MKAIRTFTGMVFLSIILVLSACAEDTKTAKMRVKLTSTQASKQEITTKDLTLVSAINLDILRCEMHYSRPKNVEGWFALPCYEGIYNLMELSQDITTVLVYDTDLPQGTITQFRLVLGNENSIEMGGGVFPLKVPSGEQSGLKINLKEDLQFDHWIEVRLIFDPNETIVEQGNGEYILTPVIKVDIITQD